MKISIVIPVFNGARTIRRCLDSIKKQEGVDREVLIIDGGSQDETLRTIEEYGELIDYLVSEPDQGQSHAINKGLQRASGEILCWLCCDDEFTEGALSHITRAFGKHREVDAVTGACRRIFPGGFEQVRKVTHQSWTRVGYNNEFDQPGVFWSREVHEKLGGLDESYHLAMDWEFWNRLKPALRRYEVVDEVVANYHFSADNKTSGNPKGHLEETRRVVRHYGPYEGQTERLYSHLYETFDLRGCYDTDARIERRLREEHHAYLKFAKTLFEEDVVNMYNWNWISRMMRGLV